MECRIFSAMLLGARAKQQDCIMDGTSVFQADLLIRKNKYTTENLLLTVCDGMGGHEGGEMASRFVCEQLQEKYNDISTESVEGIKRIFSTIQENSRTSLPSNSGTTIAGLRVSDNTVLTFNAGDSRVYKLTPAGITSLSHDHSLVQDLIDNALMSGDRAFRHPLKNYIEFGIGPVFTRIWQTREVFLHQEMLESSAWYLLCTDGLTDILPDAEIHKLLMPAPIDYGSRLFNAIRGIGAKDNCSFIIVEIR